MTRFWMVQHVMCWVLLLLNILFHWSWWGFAAGAVCFAFSGFQFGRYADRDDKRNRLEVHNLTITGGAA